MLDKFYYVEYINTKVVKVNFKSWLEQLRPINQTRFNKRHQQASTCANMFNWQPCHTRQIGAVGVAKVADSANIYLTQIGDYVARQPGCYIIS